MKVQYLDEQGKSREPIMGTYGIGIDRTMAAVLEQNNDKDGILWPMSIAPYQVILLPLGEEALPEGERLYSELQDEGIEVLLDDRDARPGVKFKDADLIGIPIRVTLGKKSLQENKVEVKFRGEKEPVWVELTQLPLYLKEKIREEEARLKEKLKEIQV